MGVDMIQLLAAADPNPVVDIAIIVFVVLVFGSILWATRRRSS